MVIIKGHRWLQPFEFGVGDVVFSSEDWTDDHLNLELE